jgi:hypothetical protein
MTERAQWTCPSCKCVVTTRYCALCGERALDARDLTLRGLIRQIFEELTDIDARFMRSLRYLVMHPGVLTRAYIEGQRKPYLLPFTLFIVANLLFFGAQSLASTTIFATPLDQLLDEELWGNLGQQLVTSRLESTQLTLDLYAPVYDQAVLSNAKSLIILMVLCFSLLPPLLFFRSRPPYVTHIVFSLHFYAFLLLLFCAALGIAELNVLMGGAGLESETHDQVFSVVLILACGIYLYLATRNVYGETGISRIVKVIALTVGVVWIYFGYRFALLPITLYTT